MQTVLEIEKNTAEKMTFTRKKFCTEDTHKMVEAGILPEESGWELINGIISEKVKISSRNAGVSRKLNKLLGCSSGNKFLVSIRNPVHIDKYNEPEPDIALLKPRENFYIQSLPEPADVLLVIEVSDSTLAYDREVKKTMYAEAGIAEFWLINLKENTVERYSSPKNGNYHLVQILEKGETIKANSVENLELPVEEILG